MWWGQVLPYGVKKGGNSQRARNRLAVDKLVRQGASWSGGERNCLFLNQGALPFDTASYVTGFDFADDARGISLVDWDKDGDLDVWMTNRYGPQVRYLENQTTNSRWISLKLNGDGKKVNRDAIGATIYVWVKHHNQSTPIKRFISAGGTFVSQSSSWAHAGLGQDMLEKVEILWPDGTSQEFHDIQENNHYLISYGKDKPEKWQRPTKVNIPKISPPEPQMGKPSLRMALDYPLPPLKLLDHSGKNYKISNQKYTLIKVWEKECQVCQEAFRTLPDKLKLLSQNEISLLLVNGDFTEDGAPALHRYPSDQVIQASLSKQSIASIKTLIHTVFTNELPVDVPFHLLVDEKQALVAVYLGDVDANQVILDAKGWKTKRGYWKAVPFAGHMLHSPLNPLHIKLATAYSALSTQTNDPTFMGHASKVLEHGKPFFEKSPQYHIELGVLALQTKKNYSATNHFEQALRLKLTKEQKLISKRNLGIAQLRNGKPLLAYSTFEQALNIAPDAQSYFFRAMIERRRGFIDVAEETLIKSIEASLTEVTPLKAAWLTLEKMYLNQNKNKRLQALREKAHANGIKLSQ